MTHKEMLERKGELVKLIRSLADKSKDEKHDWTGEDEQEWVRVNKEIDELQEKIDTEEQRAVRADRASSLEDSLRDTRKFGREDRQGNGGNLEPECTDEHRMLALQGWLRNQNGLELSERHEEACQLAGLNPNRRGIDIQLGQYSSDSEAAWYRDDRPMLENRAGLNVGTGSAGGFTVPEGFVTELERTMLAYNGPRQVSRVIRTDTGNDLPWPTVDDTGNTGVLLAEATTIGTSVDPTFATKTLNAYKYSSKAILISEELLTDSAFNMGQLIPSLLGERLGRIQAAQFTTGTGSSQPNGIVTATSAGKTAASATAVTGDEIIDFVHSIDPAYRTGGSVGFMMNDAVLLAIRKLKTTDLQYIWQPGLQSGVADRILGFPYTINQSMTSAMTTAKKVMLFGDFSKFIIRDVASVRLYRLEERYRDLDQTGFIAFMRSDSELIQASAVKHLILA